LLLVAVAAAVHITVLAVVAVLEDC